MRILAVPLLALITLPGCMTVHAHVPEEAIRHHLAKEEGIDLAATCSYQGQSYSEGAGACMAAQRMTCDPTGRWVQDGAC